jgi:DNA-directed RNA polymerase III subunit RPC3
MFVVNSTSVLANTDKYQGRSVYRLDHDKLRLVLQHQTISDRVRQRMGSRPGKVLSALLRQCETPELTGGDSQQPPSADRRSIKPRMEYIDLERLLHDVNNSDNTSGGENRGVVNGYANGTLSHGDEIDMEELEEQVATLAEGSCDFISLEISQDKQETTWRVNLDSLEDQSRNEEIMQMVKQRFGLMSLRIIRILMSRGKVDEKALQEIGLLNAKDLRRCLAQLHAHGFIDLQEVPREPQRQPARTIYLWFYDAERVKMRMMENLYKAMCRLLQRLKVERQTVSSTVQKAERSDVKGKEHEILSSDEITVLNRWRRKELWYLSELERLGSSVDVCAWK